MTSAAAESPVLVSIADGPETDAAARSLLYEELGSALRFPDEAFYKNIASGGLRTRLCELVEGLPYVIEGAEQLLAAITCDGSDYDLFQS